MHNRTHCPPSINISLFFTCFLFLWNSLFSSFLLNFCLPLTFCFVNWLFLLCVSFFPSLPALWQKVTCCSCWEHPPDDCENKVWLVDCWRKWQMPLPKWRPHKCQEVEEWKSSHFQPERYHLIRTWTANRSLCAVGVWGFLPRLFLWSGSSSAPAFPGAFPLDRLKILLQDIQMWPAPGCPNRALHE